jgi:hypothetical protein
MYKVTRRGKNSIDQYIKAAELIGCSELEFRDVEEHPTLVDIYVTDSEDVDRLIKAEHMLCHVVDGYDEDGKFIGLVREYTEDEVKEACQ